MSFVSRILGRIAPHANSSIAQFSHVGGFRRSIDGATGGRRGNPIAVFGDVNTEVSASAELVARRARYLAKNNPHISNGVANWASYVCGTGARPAPRNLEADSARDLVSTFDLWAEHADYDGRMDLWGLQGQMVATMYVSGEALAILHDTADGLKIQVLPPELLDRSKTTSLRGQAHIHSGVEFDAAGQRVAYWILPDRAETSFTTAAPSVRIDARNVLHVFAGEPGQVRGLSHLAPVILTASELDALQDALLVSAKMAALHAGFIKSHTEIGDDLGWSGETAFEPGTLTCLPANADVSFNSPEQLKDAPAFLKHNLQAIAAGLGIPVHLLDGDLSDANYSSLRAGMLAFKRRVGAVQYGTLVPQMLRPVWQRWLAREVLENRISSDAIIGCDWMFPRFEMIDPQKDIAAMREAVNAGFASRSQTIAELGWNVADIDAERSADAVREKDLGLMGGTVDAA
ncbi:MAG: phage portal protein [Pseudomonadota bacterium]